MYLPIKLIDLVTLRTINSEVEIWKSVIKNFKQYRTVNQTAFYLGAGADRYYHPKVDTCLKFSKDFDYPAIARLLHDILAKTKGLKVTIVSLACGSCEKDKSVLEYLHELGYDISFFGVDSSMAMLKKASKVLHGITFNAQLICADIGAFHFKKELDRIIGEYDVAIYLFFGNTFIGNILGNLNQNYMTGILNNIIRPGDYMLLDIVGFKATTPHIQDKLLERYTGYLDNPAEVDFFLGPLKYFGVPEDCGELTLDIRKDPVTQALMPSYGFEVHTSIDFNLDGEEISLSPNEYINLFYILVYDLNELRKFLKTKKFKLKDQRIGDFANQILLQRQ